MPGGQEHESSTTRVAVVDDHRAVAQAFQAAIDGQPDMDCAGIAADGKHALTLVSDHKPDVVLMDLVLGEEDGIDLTRTIKQIAPDTRVIIVTGYPDAGALARAAEAGACGFLPKHSSMTEVLDAIRRARDGDLLADPITLGGVFEAIAKRQSLIREEESHGIKLTRGERRVLEHLGQGTDVQTAADKMGISVHTARGYVRQLFAKLDVRTQLEAVVKAMRLGLIPTPKPDDEEPDR